MSQFIKPAGDRSAFRAATSFAILWAAGLGFLWWVIVPALMAIKSRSKLKPSPEAIILTILGIWLLLVILASLLAGHVDTNRIPGAAFSAAVWIAAGIAIHWLRKLTLEQNFAFIRGLIFIGSLQGALTLVAVTFHPSPVSQFNLLSTPILSGAGGVGAWVQSNLAYTDYFGGVIVRSSGLMATAAWSGGYACLILVLLLVGRKHIIAAGMSQRRWVLAVSLNLVSLYFSYSRVSTAIVVSIVAVYVLYRVCATIDRGLLATMILIATAVVVFSVSPWRAYILEQDSLRPGSSDARLASYGEGFDVASGEGVLAFIAGNGVKPYLEDLGRGAGSESTYVSLLVRGGLIAVVLFGIFVFLRLCRAFRAQDWTGLMLLIALAIHALVEDLDVGTLTLLLSLIEPARLVIAPQNARIRILGAVPDSGHIGGRQGAHPTRLFEPQTRGGPGYPGQRRRLSQRRSRRTCCEECHPLLRRLWFPSHFHSS